MFRTMAICDKIEANTLVYFSHDKKFIVVDISAIGGSKWNDNTLLLPIEIALETINSIRTSIEQLQAGDKCQNPSANYEIPDHLKGDWSLSQETIDAGDASARQNAVNVNKLKDVVVGDNKGPI